MIRSCLSIAFVCFLASLFTHCLSTSQSRLQTTSDGLKEFRYKVRGSIELSVDHEEVLLAHAVDIQRNILRHPDYIEENERLEELLNNQRDFVSDFDASYAQGWPLVDRSGNLDRSKLAYWVGRQVKYATIMMKAQHLSLAFQDFVEEPTARRRGDKVVIDYFANLTGARLLASERISQEELRQSPLNPGDLVTIPQNPIEIYYDTHSDAARFRADYRKERGGGGFQLAVANRLLKEGKVVEKTIANNPPCRVPGENPASPFTYFLYFNPLREGCRAPGMTILEVMEVAEQEPRQTFPEYERIFDESHAGKEMGQHSSSIERTYPRSDKEVTIFVYMGNVSVKEKWARVMLENMREQGYRVEEFKLAPFRDAATEAGLVLEENIYSKDYAVSYARVSNRINGINFIVEVVLRRHNDDARTMLREAISSREVIIYDGHAGCGVNIDRNFTEAESYPRNVYQIFFLGGCTTYLYGRNSVLQSKSERDSDPFFRNVDLITTFAADKGGPQNEVIIDALERAAELYDKPVAEWSDADIERLSWLGIIVDINDIMVARYEKERIYAVSGEINNEFRPIGMARPE